MKILQVIPYFCFGGAETMCENLTYALTKAGHEVCVVSLYADRTPISQRMEEAGVRIEYLDKKLGLDLSMIPKLATLMKKEKPDVVHTHLDVIKYAVAAAKLAGVRKCVHTVHNVADKEAEGRIQKYTNKLYFKLGWSTPVALSPEVQRTILDFYGLTEADVPVIYNGIDLSRCQPKENYEAGETVTLLHIGRFNEQKNHKGLLEMFRKLKASRPQCRLELIGDGELRAEMEAHAKTLGIEDSVAFLGSQSNVYPYLQKADLFVLPSKYEGMPMTIIEAMGSGLGVVAADVGGIRDMLTEGVSGYLVHNQEEFLRACRTLIDDEDLRRKMGQQAMVDSRRFSAEYMAEQYGKAYQK